MTDDEVERLAEKLVPILISKIKETKHDFWIDPQEHYNAHRDMAINLERACHALGSDDLSDIKRMVFLYRLTTGLFVKFFLGMVIVGSVVLAGIGLLSGK